MDEMKLKLSTLFMRGLVAKFIEKTIYKKFGCKVNVELNDLIVGYTDGKAHLTVDMDADIEKEELGKILKSIGL